MKHIKVTIQGTTPLLCSRFTDNAQIAATRGNRVVSGGEQASPQKQAEERLYIGHDQKPMIPQPNILRCLVDGGAFFRMGRVKITTQKSSLLSACLGIEEIEIPIKHKESWMVDIRPVRNPSTGGRFLCYRPSFHDWELTFTLAIDTEMISVSLVREILDMAGKRVGLGDFRPSCKGPFGKFVVIFWKEE